MSALVRLVSGVSALCLVTFMWLMFGIGGAAFIMALLGVIVWSMRRP